MSAPRPRRVLFVSNGHGEDAIAAGIIRGLPPGIVASAYPTLGNGWAFEDLCAVVGPRARLPSEGWRNVRGSVLRDVAGGGLSTILPGLAFARRAARDFDRVVVVGDMVGVYGCFVTGLRNIVYVDVYKTGFGSAYLPLDRLVLKRTAQKVFCRAETLAHGLRQAGVAALCAGNVMMDTIPRTPIAPLPRGRRLGLAVLPGSRAHALENFALQAAALRLVAGDDMPDLFMAVAPSLDPTALAEAGGMRHEPPQDGTGPMLGRLTDDVVSIALLPGRALGNVLDAADLVLSQAGTASVQAAGLGRPVITFRSARDRLSRFADEGRMFGEARIACAAEPTAIAEALLGLLRDEATRARSGEAGRERIGGPGALEAIAQAI